MRRLIELLPPIGLTLAWLMPLHIPPWGTWHSEVPVFAGVLVAGTWAALAIGLRRGPVATVEMPTMMAALLAIAALTCLQAATGEVRFFGDAWIVTLYLVLCASAFLLGHQAMVEGRAERYSRSLAWTLLIAGLGCTVIALVQAFDVWDASEWIVRTPAFRRSGSNLGQPNQMATVVLMGAVSLMYLHETRRIGPVATAVVGAVLGLGLATTESRTALLAVGALATWWFCRGYSSRISRVSVVSAVAFVLLAYASWPPLLEAYHGQAGAELARVNTQIGFRTIVWPQLLEAAMQKPWLGWGVRQTSLALTSVVHAHPISEPYTYAHNIVLESILAFGIPITVLLLAGAALWLSRRWSARRTTLGWYCMALWVPLTIHALLEFPYAYAYLLAPAMLALGILDGTSSPVQAGRVPITVVIAGLAATWLLAAWSVRDYIEVEEDFRVARFEAGRIGVTPADYERPKVRLLTQLGALVEAARLLPEPGMSAEQVALAGEAAARWPWPALQNRYALALALNGQPSAAEKELRVILAMHGEASFHDIRLNWQTLQSGKYPQLGTLHMPAGPASITK